MGTPQAPGRGGLGTGHWPKSTPSGLKDHTHQWPGLGTEFKCQQIKNPHRIYWQARLTAAALPCVTGPRQLPGLRWHKLGPTFQPVLGEHSILARDTEHWQMLKRKVRKTRLHPGPHAGQTPSDPPQILEPQGARGHSALDSSDNLYLWKLLCT